MRHLIFDTETTGIPKNSLREPDKQPRLIELACATWDDATDAVFTFGATFNPGVPIPPEVTKVTGLTDSKVKDSPEFSEQADNVFSLIESVNAVVAHNLSFDKLVLNNEFDRVGKPRPRWPRGVCTVEATEHLNGYRMKLSELHRFLFAEDMQGAHRAEADVEALLKCYRELIKRGEI